MVAAGDTLQETLALQKEPAQTPATIAGTKKPKDPAARPRSSERPGPAPENEGLGTAAQVTWIGTGVLAASAAVTGTFAYLQAKKLANLRDSATSTQDERDAVQRKGKTLALTTDILAGAAVLAGATALYLTFGSSSDDAEQEGQARVGLRGPSVVLTYQY